MSYDPNKLRRRATAVSITLAAALAVATTVFVADHVEPKNCTSPAVKSRIYPPSTHNPDRRKWLGIDASVNTADLSQYDGVKLVISYSNGDPDGQQHDSYPIDPASITASLGEVALLIGTGEVQFRAFKTAPNGSPACNAPPAVSFTNSITNYKLQTDLVGYEPTWPN